MNGNAVESFNSNLLDIIIEQESKPKFSKNAPEVFRFLMVNVFFKQEVSDNKSFSLFLEKTELPPELNSLTSLKDIDMELLRSIINRDSVDKSFAGVIMLSKTYMKNFHPNHPNEIIRVPVEIRLEMRADIAKKNKAIIDGFEEMKKDMEADKKRKIVSLVALSLKNITMRTGIPFKNVDEDAGDVIKKYFPNSDEIFTASQKQMTILSDQSIVRDFMKLFFVVKTFQDLKTLSDLFAKEIERFARRAKMAFPSGG